MILGGLTRNSGRRAARLAHARRASPPGRAIPLIGTPVTRRDEIGELADAFVEMDQTLVARQRDLESTLDLQRHLIEDNPLAIAVLDAEYCIGAEQQGMGWACMLPEPAAELERDPRRSRKYALGWRPTRICKSWTTSQSEDAEGIMHYWNLRKAELSYGHRGSRPCSWWKIRTQQHLLETALHAGRKTIGARGGGRRRSARNQKPPRHCTEHLRPAAAVGSQKKKRSATRLCR